MTSVATESAVVRSGRYFHIFSYGSGLEDRLAAGLLEGCELVAEREVAGTLYDIDGEYPALVLAGNGRVAGEIWRCPVEVLPELDSDERVVARQLNRIGLQVDEFACWVYVVGPKLARHLAPGRRLASSAPRALPL